MTLRDIYQFACRHKLAVVSTVDAAGHPQSAVVGIAVTENLEIIFDTADSSRKYANLQRDNRIALVIGWEEETLQLEGRATLLAKDGDELAREIYYGIYPDGRERARTWPGLVHFKVSPTWARYSSFNEPIHIEEMKF